MSQRAYKDDIEDLPVFVPCDGCAGREEIEWCESCVSNRAAISLLRANVGHLRQCGWQVYDALKVGGFIDEAEEEEVP